jgi:hypothetical protein
MPFTIMQTIQLIIEQAKVGELWGRVHYNNNLIVDRAENLEQLQANMKVLLADFHDLQTDSITFEISYDLSAFFENFSYLKISEIAKYGGLNARLLRRYVAGSKTANNAQILKLQEVIKRVSEELAQATSAY